MAAVGGVEEVAGFLAGRLGGAPCALAVDIDGTLTERRRQGDFLLDLEAVRLIRVVEGLGVRVLLVTGNSAPVVAGLGRYLGASGPHVAENGCVVYTRGRVWHACRETARPAARAIEEELSWLLEPSWQNSCRLHDYAFLARGRGVDPAGLVSEAERVLRERGLRARLSSSGYALHVRPVDASKGRGLAVAAALAGLDTGCMVAVGDSGIDVEMKPPAAVLAAVGNADEELKRRADLVLPGPSGAGLRVLLEAVAGLARR